jgi:hypothetical protein
MSMFSSCGNMLLVSCVWQCFQYRDTPDLANVLCTMQVYAVARLCIRLCKQLFAISCVLTLLSAVSTQQSHNLLAECTTDTAGYIIFAGCATH